MFLALPLPEAVGASLSSLVEPARVDHPGARWIDPSALHVTLVFLGSLPASSVPGLVDAARMVAARSSSFSVSLGSPGGSRGGRRAGVGWLEVADGRQEVEQLARALDARIAEAGILASPSLAAGRRLRPHVTVARRASPGSIAAMRDCVARQPTLSWHADAVCLYRSHISTAAAVYEELARVALAPPETPAAGAPDREAPVR